MGGSRDIAFQEFKKQSLKSPQWLRNYLDELHALARGGWHVVVAVRAEGQSVQPTGPVAAWEMNGTKYLGARLTTYETTGAAQPGDLLPPVRTLEMGSITVAVPSGDFTTDFPNGTTTVDGLVVSGDSIVGTSPEGLGYVVSFGYFRLA